MHMPDLLRQRAAECETMATIAPERDSKAAWSRMAERWHRCAEVELKANLSAAHHDGNRHRKPAPPWMRH